MAQLMELQSAMAKAQSFVTSQRSGNHVAAQKERNIDMFSIQLQSHAETVDQKLRSVLEAGLPNVDPVVAEAEKVVKTLGQMRVEVRPWHCPRRDLYIRIWPEFATQISDMDIDTTKTILYQALRGSMRATKSVIGAANYMHTLVWQTHAATP